MSIASASAREHFTRLSDGLVIGSVPRSRMPKQIVVSAGALRGGRAGFSGICPKADCFPALSCCNRAFIRAIGVARCCVNYSMTEPQKEPQSRRKSRRAAEKATEPQKELSLRLSLRLFLRLCDSNDQCFPAAIAPS